MKKTLAIVLALVMAVAALSSFAFVVGEYGNKANFELLKVYAVDIDVAKAGVRDYQELKESTDYWTPGKSLAIAIDFRTYNRSLDGYNGVKAGDAWTVLVTNPTGDLSFCQYAVPVVVSSVTISGQKTLSYVAQMPVGTVSYVASAKAAAFTVLVAPRNTVLAPVNVLSSTIIGNVKAYGYVPQYLYSNGTTSAAVGTGAYITVPELLYGADPAYVDYTVIISSKHVAANDENLGELSAMFALSYAEDWVSINIWDSAAGTWGPTSSAYPYVVDEDMADKTTKAYALQVALEARYSTYDLTDDPTINDITLGAFYSSRYGATLTAASSDAAYTAYLDLASVGYLIVRVDMTVTLNDVAGTIRSVVRYDVFKYDAVIGYSTLNYIASFLTEDLLVHSNARAINLEYNGGIVTTDMWGNYMLSSDQKATVIAGLDTDPWGLSGWVGGSALSTSVYSQYAYRTALAKALADFEMNITQREGYPILDSQFLNAAADATYSTPVTNTYLGGLTTAIPVEPAAEGSEAPVEPEPESEPEPTDDPDIPESGDATIAFVCAAAAILACAALAFVMKKAR